MTKLCLFITPRTVRRFPFQPTCPAAMRLVDFLTDIRDTSARIAERGAYVYNDPDLCAELTVRTLMRPDVTAYFDSLLSQSALELSPVRSIVYYLYMYALAVNRRPAPTAASMPAAAQKAWHHLHTLDLNRDTCVLAKPPRIKLPGSRQVRKLFGQETASGLFCTYLANPSAKDSIAAEPDCASLLIFPSSATVPLPRESIFSGRVFITQSFSLDALYVGSAP